MPAEERKLATILFADLVGSTELAGGQDPERVRAMLDRFYDSMAAEIDRADGTVEKFVGDAVMAAFGAPTAHEDDAERALRGALAMQRRLGGVFVGRDNELGERRAAYGRVEGDGRSHLLTILGDAGVGKTRLVRELWQWLSAQSPQPLLRTGRCLSYGEGITYWPLGEVLKEHFGILESDPPETVARRLEGREFLGFTLGLPPPEDMHPLT